MTPAESPAGRAHHSMVHDPASGLILMWAGAGPNVRSAELWGFDPGAATWTLLNPDPGIGTRMMATAVHDAGSGSIVLIGGEGTAAPDAVDPGLVFSDEVLVADGVSGAIGERRRFATPIWRHAAAYDPGLDRIVVLFLDETWLYDSGEDVWEDVTDQSLSVLGRPLPG